MTDTRRERRKFVGDCGYLPEEVTVQTTSDLVCVLHVFNGLQTEKNPTLSRMTV